MIFQKILKLLPEKDILTTLEEFDITQDKDECSMIGLSVANKEDIIIDSNGGVTLKKVPNPLNLYEHNEQTYRALKDLYKNQQNKFVQFFAAG